MHIGTITPAYQPPKIEDEPVHVDAIEPDLCIDSEENAPQQEGIIHEVYERPGKEYLQESPELHSQVNDKNVVQRCLHKQAEMDKILKVIHNKILKGMHLLVTVNEIQVVYLNSPYSKDVYLHSVCNKLPSHKVAVRRTKKSAEKYMRTMYLVNGDSSPMHMCMGISSIRG